jgi:hypothetical protein
MTRNLACPLGWHYYCCNGGDDDVMFGSDLMLKEKKKSVDALSLRNVFDDVFETELLEKC